MGTTALWQSTDRTSGHGLTSTGDGSRRRVREFRIGSDTFADLRTGEAVIHTIHAHPTRVIVDPLTLPDNHAVPRIGNGPRHCCEIRVDAATEPGTQPKRKPGAPKRKRPPAKNGDAQLTLARAIPTSPPSPPTTPARTVPGAVQAPDTPHTTDVDLDDL
jgi:hypothetical protein